MNAPSPTQTTASTPGGRRYLLKLSGEALAAPGEMGYDAGRLGYIAGEIRAAVHAGAAVAVVVGGGNLIRGATLSTDGRFDRVTADGMGMLGTMMNALALAEALRSAGVDAAAHSAIGVPGVIPHFARDNASAELDAGRTLVLGGGTGNPFFTTDSCAALRAAQLGCREVLKATKVDGVYSDDPAKNPDATRFDTLSFDEAIARDLRIMDTAALAICRDSGVAVRVFRFDEPGSIAQAVTTGGAGTLVTP